MIDVLTYFGIAGIYILIAYGLGCGFVKTNPLNSLDELVSLCMIGTIILVVVSCAAGIVYIIYMLLFEGRL